MNTSHLKFLFLLCGMFNALYGQQYNLTGRLRFMPNDPPKQDLYTWTNIELVLYSSDPDTIFVYPELEILHNDVTFFHLRRLDSLPIPSRQTMHIDRYQDFVGAVFDVFDSEPIGDYVILKSPNWEELAPIALTRQLPASKWQFCFRFRDLQGNPFPDVCRTFEWTDYLPPAPIYPSYDMVFSPYSPVCLQWTPVTPSTGFQSKVLLQIYEILPGQDAVDALRSNLAIVEEEVIGVSRWFWSPTAMMVNPGDSVRYAWQVTALAPAAILDQENGATSMPATFWLKDSRPPATPYVPPCDSIYIGPDQIIEKPGGDRVRIGCAAKPGCTYEWVSDPHTCPGNGSLLDVRPEATTRYVLFQTNDSTQCTVYDEVYVSVRTAFTVQLQVDPCGMIRPKIIPISKAQPSQARISGDTDSVMASPIPSDAAVVANGVPYDINGRALGGFELPPALCHRPMPPAKSPAPELPYNYAWSTGEVSSEIHPTTAGNYTCTVSMNGERAVDSIDYTPSSRFHGDFTYLAYTAEMRLKDPQRPFVIKQNGNEDNLLPIYNALGFHVELSGPFGYHRVWERTTTEGFSNGEIRWEGEPDQQGVPARPGTYTCSVSLTNCDHPDHSEIRRYPFAELKDGTTPLNQAKDKGLLNTFEIKVRAAQKQQPQNASQQ